MLDMVVVVIFVLGVFLSSILYFTISFARNRQYGREIARTLKLLEDRDATIKALHDRLMSRDLSEYKAYEFLGGEPPLPPKDIVDEDEITKDVGFVV